MARLSGRRSAGPACEETRLEFSSIAAVTNTTLLLSPIQSFLENVAAFTNTEFS